MGNNSGDRSNQVQDSENNGSGEQSPIPVSQERHRNDEKDSLANRKHESQSKVTKRKKKSRKRKVSTSGEDPDSSSTDFSSPAKKKKKAKHRRHHQPTSSSTSTASNSSTDEESHNDRFKIITENEKFKWKLPKSMANYANKYFEEYFPEHSLKEAILWQNPVPDNLDDDKKLDDFLRDILKEKRKANEQNIENVLEKPQRKTVDVMGPLSKLWNILERAKGAEEDAVQISINDLLHYVEQTVLLLGQNSNAITYHRRLNVLGSAMTSQYQVKSMLKEKASLLQKHDEYLFGKKFRYHIADTIKSKKQTKEIFIEHKKSFSFSPSHAPRKCERQKFFLRKIGSKKFHNGNQQQQQQHHTYYAQAGSQQQRYGRYNYSTADLLQHGFKSRKTDSVEIKKVDLHNQGTVLFGMSRKWLILLNLNGDKMRISGC